jgi:hypothetical protein
LTLSIEEHIPEIFWTQTVEPQLLQAITDFEKHKENIEENVFLEDFIK